jgi:hypothetical protein
VPETSQENNALKEERMRRLVGKLPSYEDYLNGKPSAFDDGLEARRREIRERPEN